MSAPEMTEQAAPDPLDAEARSRADAWSDQQSKAMKAELHRRWGYRDEDVAQGLEKAAYTTQRLALGEEAADEAERLLGPVNALEVAAKWADGLSSLPPSMTPEHAAEEIRDLIPNREFFARLEAGDRAAHRLWDGLNTLAARRR